VREKFSTGEGCRTRELGNVRCCGTLMRADNIFVLMGRRNLLSSRLVISHLVKSLEASEHWTEGTTLPKDMVVFVII
jgi:hypothetical protein